MKLLRVIQEKSVRPVDASAELPVDVRILSSTHNDLSQLVNEGKFRHDLFYRINVIELKVPPLRERRDDIPDLAAAILSRLASDNNEPARSLTRSEEHTSELQSLMRISYAVFCLKKKKQV